MQRIFHLRSRAALLALVSLILLTLGGSKAPKAGDAHLVKPDQEYRGHTYGEWHALWWQWADSFTNQTSPVVQKDGVISTSNQSGNVWFLAGYFGTWGTAQDPVTCHRSITIPPGTALFFPVLNGELTPEEYADPINGAADPNNPSPENLWAMLESWFADPTGYAMEATIDGRPVENMLDYRAPMPDPYTTYLPPNDNHMAPTYYAGGGDVYPVVCDGFCLLVKPLPVGKHTVSFKATFGTTLGLNVTYEVTVAPPGKK